MTVLRYLTNSTINTAAVTDLPDVSTAPGGLGIAALTPWNVAGSDYGATLAALITALQANDGSVDPASATLTSALTDVAYVIGLASDGTVRRVPVGQFPSGGTAPSPATTFTNAVSSTSGLVGNALTLTVTPGTGGWPSGVTVTPTANGLTGTFSPTSATPTGTTAPTFAFTPSAAGSGTLNATATSMTSNGATGTITITAAAANTFTVSASPASVAIGSTSTLTVTPGSGGWPSGKVVTAIATTVTGTFDAATKTGSGTTPVTFTFTATGSAASGSLSASAPGMTLSGGVAALTTTAAAAARDLALVNPVFNTATPIYGTGSLAGGSGTSTITIPANAYGSGAASVSIKARFRGTAGQVPPTQPGNPTNFLTLTRASDGFQALRLSFNGGNTIQGSAIGGSYFADTSNIRDGAVHFFNARIDSTAYVYVNMYVDGSSGTAYAAGGNPVLTAGDYVFKVDFAGLASGDNIDSIEITADVSNYQVVPAGAAVRSASTIVIYQFDGSGVGT